MGRVQHLSILRLSFEGSGQMQEHYQVLFEGLMGEMVFQMLDKER